MNGLSIIIPNRNGKDVIHTLLQSIKVQKNISINLEIIVIDDASEDHSINGIIAEYLDVIIVRNAVRKGAATCKNQGVERASHEWLLFLDNDIILPENFISSLLSSIARYPLVACFQPKILFKHDNTEINSAGGIANMFGYAWDRGIFEIDTGQFDVPERIFFATSAAMVIKKELIKKVGMFDADYGYLNEDFDLGYRLNMIGAESMYVPDTVCYHHMSYTMGRDNPTVKYLMERNRVMTILKNYECKTLRQIGVLLCQGKVKKYFTYFKHSRYRTWKFVGAVIKCWLWIIVHLPKIFFKRISVQRLRMYSDAEIFKIMGRYTTYFPLFSQSCSSHYAATAQSA